ncbi:uncharacterized protein LOC115227178 [Octopus sinensis]|uniref:Small ribosomal subunit protein uS5m n=1 Tax=Octopus sinensis TaxID=2607531 RepID=A0A6P7TYZ5_9MOLL|nr:uncharacterized protein LOC115227178 [Octopus sinensis]
MVDGVGGLGIGEGAAEIATCSRDGTVKVWDPRQPDSPVVSMEPSLDEKRRDCWALAFVVMLKVCSLWIIEKTCLLRNIQHKNISTTCIRSSFFDRSNSEDLWKTVTSVSPAGLKKGRGKMIKKVLDLNTGQKFGFEVIPDLKSAKISASNNLLYFDLFENRTVYHDMDWSFGAARMTVIRKDAGYGIISQRILAKLFYLVGVEDVYVKLLRKCKNIESICAAFINGMLSMETHQNLADKTGLYLVKCSSDLMGYPIILSRPSNEVESSDLSMSDLDKIKLDYKIPRIKSFTSKKTVPVSEMTHNLLSRHRRRNQHSATIFRKVNKGYSRLRFPSVFYSDVQLFRSPHKESGESSEPGKVNSSLQDRHLFLKVYDQSGGYGIQQISRSQ